MPVEGLAGQQRVTFAVPVAGAVDRPFQRQNDQTGYVARALHLDALGAASRAAAAERIRLIDILQASCSIPPGDAAEDAAGTDVAKTDSAVPERGSDT